MGQALTDGHEGQAVLCVHHQLSLCGLGFPRIRVAAPAGGAGTDASGGGVERTRASGRKRPERSAMMRRIILLLVWSVSLWGCGTAARDPGPTAQGYVVHASAVPNTLFLPSDLVSQAGLSHHGDAAGAGARRARDARGGGPGDVPVRRLGMPGGGDALGPAGGHRPGARVHYADGGQHHGRLPYGGACGECHAGTVGGRVIATRPYRPTVGGTLHPMFRHRPRPR